MLDRYRTLYDWPEVSPGSFFSWNSPWRTLDLLTQHLGRAWEELDRNGSGSATHGHADVHDTGAELELRVELPGVSKDNVELSVTGDSVFVRATRDVEVPEGYTPHRRERASYKFERAWKLPIPVDSQKAEAQLRDGVLSVRLPKSPNAQPKQISVKAG